jgi:hypothetical protein
VGHDHLGGVSRRQFHLRRLHSLSPNGPVFMGAYHIRKGVFG